MCVFTYCLYDSKKALNRIRSLKQLRKHSNFLLLREIILTSRPWRKRREKDENSSLTRAAIETVKPCRNENIGNTSQPSDVIIACLISEVHKKKELQNAALTSERSINRLDSTNNPVERESLGGKNEKVVVDQVGQFPLGCLQLKTFPVN